MGRAGGPQELSQGGGVGAGGTRHEKVTHPAKLPVYMPVDADTDLPSSPAGLRGLRPPPTMKTPRRRVLFSILFLLAGLSESRAAVTEIMTVATGDPRIRSWSTGGSFLGDAAGLATDNQAFTSTSDFEFDGTNYYAISAGDPRVRKFDARGNFVSDYSLLTSAGAPVYNQVGLAYDGQHFFTIGANDFRIREFSLGGEYITDIGALRTGTTFLTNQTGLATDGSYFYTVAAGDSRIRKFDLTGNFLGDLAALTLAGAPFGTNTGLAMFTPAVVATKFGFATPIPESGQASLLAGVAVLLAVVARRRQRCGAVA